MQIETMIHVPTTETDVAIATDFLYLYVHKRPVEFGERVTVGAYVGDGIWELVDYTEVANRGFKPAGKGGAKRVGTMWFEPVIGASPVVRWERSA